MKYLLKLSNYLSKYLLSVITLSVILGLILGHSFNLKPLKSLILPLTILIVYPNMIGLPLKSIFTFDDQKVLLYMFLVNFFLIPLIGFFVITIFLNDQEVLSFGLLLISVLPTSGGMTIAWTGLAKGNIKAAIKMTVIGLLLGALLAPFYLKLLLGKTLVIPLFTVMRQIFMIIFIPLVLGQITRLILLKKYGENIFKEKIKSKLPSLSTWGLIGLIFIAVSLKTKTIINNPALILTMIIPLIIFYTVSYLFISIIGKAFLNRADAIALVYGSALRSLSIALVLAMTILGERGAEIALLIAVAYVIQIQTATWFVKLTNVFLKTHNL